MINILIFLVYGLALVAGTIIGWILEIILIQVMGIKRLALLTTLIIVLALWGTYLEYHQQHLLYILVCGTGTLLGAYARLFLKDRLFRKKR